jgi:hypothetical protein
MKIEKKIFSLPVVGSSQNHLTLAKYGVRVQVSDRKIIQSSDLIISFSVIC